MAIGRQSDGSSSNASVPAPSLSGAAVRRLGGNGPAFVGAQLVRRSTSIRAGAAAAMLRLDSIDAGGQGAGGSGSVLGHNRQCFSQFSVPLEPVGNFGGHKKGSVSPFPRRTATGNFVGGSPLTHVVARRGAALPFTAAPTPDDHAVCAQEPALSAAVEDAAEVLSPRLQPHLQSIKAIYLGAHAADDVPTNLSNRQLDAILSSNRAEEANSREQELQSESAELRTCEDAIAFFARSGGLSATKFVYCNLRDREGQLHPYDLEVVPKEKVNQEHFIVSKSGIVHVKPGEQAECCSLPEWARNSLIHQVLSTKVFKLHVHRKAFLCWHRGARSNIYDSRRRALALGCLFARPRFAKPLAEVRQAAGELQQALTLLCTPNNTSGSQPLELSDFRALQDAQLCRGTSSNACAGPGANLSAKPARASSSAPATAQRAVEERSRQMLGMLDKVVAAAVDPAALRLPQKRFEERRRKPLVQEKAEALAHSRRQEAWQNDRGMLGRCIHLVEHVLHAALVGALLRSIGELRARFEGKAKLFTVCASCFGQDGQVVLEPSHDEFMGVLDTVWGWLCKVLCAHEVVTGADRYLQYLPSKRSSSDASMAEVIQRCPHVWDAWSQLREALSQQLRVAHRHAVGLYAPYLQMYQLGFPSHRAVERASHVGLEEMVERSAAQHLRECLQLLGKFRQYASSGILVIDARPLQKELQCRVEREVVAAAKQQPAGDASLLVTEFTLNFADDSNVLRDVSEEMAALRATLGASIHETKRLKTRSKELLKGNTAV